jgi:hypothetical protein
MRKTMKNLEAVFDELVVKLTNRNGKSWKEIRGEIHPQYNEIPFWILMYQNSDIGQVMEEFRKIVSAYKDLIGSLQMTVAFREFSEDGSEMIFHDFLETWDDIDRGKGDWPLGSRPTRRTFDGSSVFDARNSER